MSAQDVRGDSLHALVRRWWVIQTHEGGHESDIVEVVGDDLQYAKEGWMGWVDRADGKGLSFIVWFNQLFASEAEAIAAWRAIVQQKLDALGAELLRWETPNVQGVRLRSEGSTDV